MQKTRATRGLRARDVSVRLIWLDAKGRNFGSVTADRKTCRW
jgi:hypothetical protein